MAAPHNPARYGEIADAAKIAAIAAEIEPIRDLVTLSGGWAWHYMTPAGHSEYTHAHDHKDADIFVEPALLGSLVAVLKGREFHKETTRFDRLPGSEDFYRYVKMVERPNAPEKPIKVIFDVFAESIPFVEAQGYRVVEPNYLLSLYKSKHSSDNCWSVQIARQLLAKGIHPVGRPEMADYTSFLSAANT